MEQYITGQEQLNTGVSPRKIFSRVGMACFIILIISYSLQIAFSYLIEWFAPLWTLKPWFIWAVTFIPMYLIAVPVGIVIFKHIPVEKPKIRKMSLGKLILYLIMCCCIMYTGNLIGTLLSAAIGKLTGNGAVNPLDTLMMGSDIIYIVLVAGIIAPIIEELIFRKLIIDRVLKFGELSAIIISALMFGLFHGNLFQFFYAFGLGAMFAFIYIKTGKLRYTIAFHIIINIWSGVLPVFFIKSLDVASLGRISSTDTAALMEYLGNKLPQLMGYLLYILVVFGLFITGLVLLIVKRKTFTLKMRPAQLEKGTGFKTIFINVGMLLFIIGTLVMFILALLN